MNSKMGLPHVEKKSTEIQGAAEQSPLERALRFLKLGIAPIPLPLGKKSPPCIEWGEFSRRMPTEVEVRGFFEGNTRNIGLAMGAVSKLVAIDLDSNEAIAWAGKHLPTTAMRLKTSRGEHWLYRHPGHEITNKVKIRIGDKRLPLDVRGDGGYIVAGGSLHPSGFIYQEIGDWDLIRRDQIPEFVPSWLDSATTPSNHQSEDVPVKDEDAANCANVDEKLDRRIRKYIKSVPPAVEGNGGDDATFKLACVLVRGFALNEDDAWRYLVQWNVRCSPSWDDKDLEAKLRNARKYGEGAFGYLLTPKSRHPDDYKTSDNQLCFVDSRNGFSFDRPLASFTAQIVEEEEHDDGVERTTVYSIEGRHSSGRSLPRLAVRADQFNGMAWASQWGASAIIYAGSMTKDHLRTGIQVISRDVNRIVRYSHFGWRQIDGDYVYLTAGSVIGASGAVDDVQVVVPDEKLRDFALPPPPSGVDLREAVLASLSCLELSPLDTSIAIVVPAYAAVLAEFLPADHSVFFTGRSGNYKSERAATAQAHFGKNFDRLNLPGNFSSSANSLEKKAFIAKDMLFAIDDFCPSGSQGDVEKLHRTAERLFRAQGNHAGRGRMNADTSLRPEYYPRGLLLATGEDLPRGHSLRARMATYNFSGTDVDLTLLTKLQSQGRDGMLASAMSGFVQYVAQRSAHGLKESLRAEKTTFRDEISRGSLHARTPELLAHQLVVWKMLLQFAHEVGAISEPKHADMWCRGRLALVHAAQIQHESQQEVDPCSRFFELLHAALVMGRARISDARSGGAPEGGRTYLGSNGWTEVGHGLSSPNGETIGWYDGHDLMLDPDASYSTAQRVAREQGDTIAVSANTLWRRLVERKMIIPGESGDDGTRSAQKRMIQGRRSRVLVVADPALIVGCARDAAEDRTTVR